MPLSGLLEDLDVLHVLLDMPPLDRVQEADLQDPPVHRALREGLLLVRHHEVLPPAVPTQAAPAQQLLLPGLLGLLEDLLLEVLKNLPFSI